MLDRTKEIIQETCQQMDCELLEFSGEHDHVHLLVSIHPKLAASNLVSKLKGKSSYILRREFADIIKPMLWGTHFWSPSYCLVSCGGGSLEVVKQYIKNQQQPPSDKIINVSKKLRKV